jgi:hypothetical protein
VDLPWSTWAMMEKLRMFRIESEDIGGGGAARRQDNGALSHGRPDPACFACADCRFRPANTTGPAEAGPE